MIVKIDSGLGFVLDSTKKNSGRKEDLPLIKGWAQCIIMQPPKCRERPEFRAFRYLRQLRQSFDVDQIL